MRSRTPLRLKRLLLEHGIPQVRMKEAMMLADGRSPSEATISQILLRDIWPEKTPREFLKKQIVDFLRANNVSEEDIKAAFEIDENPGNPRIAPPSTPRGAGTTPIDDEEQLPENVMLSQQAKQHFKLFLDPFTDDVKGPDDVYLSGEQLYIRESMYQAAKHSGFLAVVGESGAGKSTLRKDLIERINREGSQITIIQPQIIDKGRLTAGAICDAIIHDISNETPRRSLEAKGRQITMLLTNSSRGGNTHVLIIEEAHDLSISTLKYLKRFWEMEDGFTRLLGIVLIGQPELKARLDIRRNWDAREVINRCEIAELQPLNGSLNDYLAMKFTRIGRDVSEICDPDVYDAIRARLTLQTRGTERRTISMMYPLMVNNTIRKAMNLAAEIGQPRIDAELINGV